MDFSEGMGIAEEEEEEAIVVEELIELVGFEGGARLEVRGERRYSGEEAMLLSRARGGVCIAMEE